MGVVVHVLQREDVGELASEFSAYDKNKTAQLYEQYFLEQENGDLVCLVGLVGTIGVGYLTIRWKSMYESFRRRSIPEIKDLSILPHYRGKGYGAGLMAHAEEMIAERSDYAGVGVGLYSDCGTAQRMYVRRGYVPDGMGLMYRNQKVEPGSRVKVDDELTIMFTKRLDAVQERDGGP